MDVCNGPIQYYVHTLGPCRDVLWAGEIEREAEEQY